MICSARLQAGTADSSKCSAAAADERYWTSDITMNSNRLL